MLSNEELFITGDINALYINNKRLMYHVANGFINLQLDIDELIECGDMAFVKAIKIFDPTKSKWSTFFSRIMANEILMENRKLKKQAQDISVETVIHEDINNNVLCLKEIIPSPIDIMETVIDSIMAKEIENFIQKLPHKKHEIFRLHLLGFKQKEIAQKLHMSQSYVSRLIKKICIDIKDAYERGA